MKTRTILRIALLFALVSVIGSCQKDKLLLYDVDGRKPDIYFSDILTFTQLQNNDYKQIKFNLLDREITDSIVLVPLTIMGAPVNYNRPVNVVVQAYPEDIATNKYITAVEGVHYEILEAVVPADSVRGYIKVRTMRATKQKDKEPAILHLSLRPNENFGTEFDSIMNNTTERFTWSVLDFHLIISDVLTMPKIWEEVYTINRWGKYTPAKYTLICSNEISGKGPIFWENNPLAANVDAVAFKLRWYLYNFYNETMIYYPDPDEDDKIMQVPGFWAMFTKN